MVVTQVLAHIDQSFTRYPRNPLPEPGFVAMGTISACRDLVKTPPPPAKVIPVMLMGKFLNKAKVRTHPEINI